MFTSCGNFRGLDCPFYAQGSGICRRPYCHFRHVRKHAETERAQLGKQKGRIDNVYPQTADVGNYVVSTPAPPPSLPPPSSSPSEPARDAPVQYVPTPIAQIVLARRRHKMASKSSRRKANKASTPTYIPTPLTQIAASSENGVRSQKYRLTDSQSEESDDSAYDPMKTNLLKDIGLISEKYSLHTNDAPAGKDEYDPLENDNLLGLGKQKGTNSSGKMGRVSAVIAVESQSSSKYNLQEASKYLSDVVCESDDNGILDPKPHQDKDASETSDDIDLYDINFDTAKIDDEEYDPVSDKTISSNESANYTPTAKYSMSVTHSKSGDDSEYDPFSNFSSAADGSSKHKLSKKRKAPHSVVGESSDTDSETLLIIDESESNVPYSEEEPALKKQCTETNATGIEVSEDEMGNENDKVWLNDVVQTSFLSDISYQPLSDSEKTFTPSYSYNPVNARDGTSSDTGEQEWNPIDYLKDLGAQSTSESSQSTKERHKPETQQQANVTGTKSVTSLKKSRSETISHKTKPTRVTKDTKQIKKSGNVSKSVDLAKKKLNHSVNNVTSKNEKQPAHTNDKIEQVNKDGVAAEKEKERPKVSSEQLSKFYNKMNENKSKQAKSNTEKEKSKQAAKLQSQQRKDVAKVQKTEAQKTSSARNTSEKLPGKQKLEEETRPAEKKQISDAVSGSCNTSVGDAVIVIDSSSSCDDGVTGKPQNVKKSDAVPKSPAEPPSSKPSIRLGRRKVSTQLLFGEDSDSDSSDVEMLQTEDEIVLISDGQSSSSGNGKIKGTKPHVIKTEDHRGTALKKHHKATTIKPGIADQLKKPDVTKTKNGSSVKKQHDRQTSQSNHPKSDKLIKKPSKDGKTHHKTSDSSQRNKKTPSVPHTPTKTPNPDVINCHDNGSDITEHYDNHSNYSSDNGEMELSDIEDHETSFSESDTFEECLRIFQEDNIKACIKEPSEMQKFKEPDEVRTEDLILSTGKQRVAHVSKFMSSTHRRCVPRPKSRPSLREVCHNRYMQAQEHRRELQEQKQIPAEPPTKSPPVPSSLTGSTKKRIAHVPAMHSTPKPPNRVPTSPVMGINAKIQMKYSIGHSEGSQSINKTIAITAPKGERRIAHFPKKVNPRPLIPPDSAAKVPSNVRQRYLNLFIDEFLKAAPTEQEAFDQGLKEEKGVYERATSKNIYLNLAINNLKRLRTAQTPSQSKVTSPTSKTSISHEAVIGGKLATQHSYTLHRSHNQFANEDKYEGAFLYERLKLYLLTEEELCTNGYPRPSDTPGIAVIKKETSKTTTNADPNQHVCSRCGKTFLRRPDGHYITRENCTYHWGKFWHKKVGGTVEGGFNCCSGTSDAKGCCIAKYHVTEDKTSNLTGYMKTVAKSPPYDGNPGLYAIDCEMCYTVKGLELTRVTVVDDKLKCVYDTLVKPSVDIVDYNTRFSGITEDDLKSVSTTLQDVQAVLLSMFSSDSVLIGHSLESDMLALKMIHSTVIDTSVLFPHRRGLPFKRALRTLMAECLNRIIQNDVGGHDSKEDAKSCMELLIWKAKQDAKKKKPFL